MKRKEKRNPRTYKIEDRYYFRAQKKFAKSDKSLAERIEEFVINAGKPERKVIVDLEKYYNA